MQYKCITTLVFLTLTEKGGVIRITCICMYLSVVARKRQNQFSFCFFTSIFNVLSLDKILSKSVQSFKSYSTFSVQHLGAFNVGYVMGGIYKH